MPSTSSTAQQRPQHSQQQQQQHTTPLSLLTQKNTPKVLLFGCQSLTFTALHFRLLRQTLHAHPENHWALDVLSELPVYIRYAGTYLPSIRESLPNVEEQLRELRRWVLSTDVEVKEEWFPLPYVLHAPMFMVGHLVQFAEFVRLQNEDKHGDSGGELMEVVGFCIGFLSAAVAAASGGSLDRLKVYGAVGVRLAMLLGVMGDAMERGRRFTSVTVLHDAEMEVEMERVIGGFPEVLTTSMCDVKIC